MKSIAFRSFAGRALPALLLSFSALSTVTVSARAQSPILVSPENFSFYVPFTVTGYVGSASLESFPVLVRLADDSPTAFHYSDCAADGSDLRFADGSGNLIPHEIDTWDATGESLVWVRVPVLSNSATFRMYYGSVAPGATASEDVWSRYAVVIHGGLSVANSVAGGPTVSIGDTAAVAADADAGKVGGGIRKGTANAKGVNVAMGTTTASTTLENTGKFSVSGWFKRNGNGNSGTHVLGASRGGWNSGEGYLLLQEKGQYIDVAARNSHQWTSGAYTLANQTWGHVAFSYEEGVAIKSYFNGNADQTKTSPGNLESSGSVWSFGSYADTASKDSFLGDMDELRIFDGVASGDWIQAEHDAVASASFLTAGEATPCEATPAPQVGVAATDVQYTNAAFTVTFASLGKNGAMTADASWADATLLVAAEDTFATPLFSIPLARVSTAPASASATAGPLATNTTYYLKVVATNSFNVAGDSGTVPFTTGNPGFAAGTAVSTERGFTSLSANATATSFGVGAESATMRLEASTDGFATVVAGAEAAAVLDAATPLSVSGLSADTTYALRVRIRNDWGLDAFVALSETATRAVPFATTGIGWTFSQDGSMIDIDFGVSGVYDGATGTATLAYNGRTVAPAKAVSGAGTLTWSAIPVADGTATATVVLSATLDGQTYSQTFTAAIAPGSAAVTVTDIAAHMTAATALRVRPGDVVTLPEPVGTDTYELGNALFGSLDGNVVTALRPGILGIRAVSDGGATTNTLAVLVLPEKIGNGDIYVLKDESFSSNWGYWNEASKWEKIGSAENDSFPHNPDDIAIVAYYRNTSVLFDARNDDVFLGGLYVGGFRDAEATARLRCTSSSGGTLLTGRYVFQRTDGKPATIQLCSNATNKRQAKLEVLNSVPAIEFASDTVLSGGWDGRVSTDTQGRFSFGSPTNGLPEGITVTLVETDTASGNKDPRMTLGNLVGGGIFWNRSAATIRFNYNSGDMGGFTGVLRDSGGLDSEDVYCVGPTQIRTPSATNCLVEVVGWVGASNGQDPDSDFNKGVGAFATGYENNYRNTPSHSPTNWFPKKGVDLHGGMLRLVQEYNVPAASEASNPNNYHHWPDDAIDYRRTDSLSVSDGFAYLVHRLSSTSTSQAVHPTTWFEAAALDHGGKASLRIYDPSRHEIASTATRTNCLTILRGVSAHAVGAGGNPESSSAYSIVPWIGASTSGNDDKVLLFGCFDADDRLVRPNYAAAPLSSWNSQDNAVVWTRGENSITLASDKTLNSLVLDDSGISSSDKQLGTGRTLTLTSGGLCFSGSGAVIGTETGGDANGALVLGDAAHPAYVWARGKESGPNQIWAPVTAPGGFVAAYTGNLVLGGDQTGIGDELVVNAGTLQLGTADRACRLAKDLPVRVYANATLKLPNAYSTGGKFIQFDGAAGWFGKVEIADGVAAKCKKAFIRDYPESPEWETLPRGVYGSSDSAATGAFVRDDLFAGTGTLEVVSDDRIQSTLMILR